MKKILKGKLKKKKKSIKNVINMMKLLKRKHEQQLLTPVLVQTKMNKLRLKMHQMMPAHTQHQ
jgi:hypothetical protein